MKTNIITISRNATYEEAARILYNNKISGAPVVDENGEIVGLISEKDLFRVLYPLYKSFYENPEIYTDFEERESKAQEIKDRSIENFMLKEVITVGPETPILRAGALMLARGISRLPVVENDRLIGIISRRDIYSAILKQNFKL